MAAVVSVGGEDLAVGDLGAEGSVGGVLEGEVSEDNNLL